MSTFAPDHLQPSTLRSLAKALKRASGDLFGTPLPLGQAQELLARTFDYPTWAAAIARAEQNGPGLATSMSIPVLTRPLASRQAFAYLLQNVQALQGHCAWRSVMASLGETCAAWGEPTWSAWCLALGEAAPDTVEAALVALIGVVEPRAVAHASEVPHPMARPGWDTWGSLQEAWQTLLDESDPLWGFLPGYEFYPGMARLKRRKGQLPTEMLGLWSEWEKNQGSESRSAFQIRQLAAGVPGAAILLAWGVEGPASLEAYKRVAQWVTQVTLPLQQVASDREESLHAALGSVDQRQLLLNVLAGSLENGQTLWTTLVQSQAALMTFGEGALACYLADVVWRGRAMMEEGTQSLSLVDILAEDIAPFDRALAVKLMEWPHIGMLRTALDELAQHHYPIAPVVLSPQDGKLLRLTERWAQFVHAQVPTGEALSRMRAMAEHHGKLGDSKEAQWLIQWQQLHHEGHVAPLRTWIQAHPEFSPRVRLALYLIWDPTAYTAPRMTLFRRWFPFLSRDSVS